MSKKHKEDEETSSVGGNDDESSSEEEELKATNEDEEEKFPDVPLYRILSQCSPSDYPKMVFGTAFQTLNGIMFPLFSIIFGALFNGFYSQTGAELSQTIGNMSLAFLGLGIAAMIFTYGGNILWAITAEKIANRLRKQYFQALLRQEISYFDRHTTGELTAKLGADIILIQAGVGEKLGQTFYYLAQILGGIVISFVYGWKMTLVMLAASPLMIMIGMLQGFLLKRTTKSGQKTYGTANSVAEDTIGGMRTVLSFVAEDKLLNKYVDLLTTVQEHGIKKSHVTAAGIGASFMFMFAVYALGFWYGGTLITSGDMQPGDVLTVFFATMIGAMGIGQGANLTPEIAKATGAAAGIFWLIDRVPEIKDNYGTGKKLSEFHGNVELTDVNFTYPTRKNQPVLQKFSLSITAGQTVALVGHSGSGKSTVIQLLERFYDPAGGAIKVDGVNIKDFDLKWYRSKIGLVSQEPILFAGTVEENVKYGNSKATTQQVEEALKMANAHEFVMAQKEGLQTYVGEKGLQLSGGQKQRIAIARAILKDPKILLLDEATSALDAESEGLVQDALEKLMKGRTTIIVAHRLTTVRDADRICVIKKGKIVEQGTHKKLLAKNGHYAKLVKKQVTEDD